MKKFTLKLIMTVSLIFGLALTASAVDVPESASPVTIETHLRFLFSQYPYSNWYSSDTTTLMDEWQDGTLNDQTAIIYPAVIFGNNFDPYVLKDTTTYYMQYELKTQNEAYFYGFTTNASYYSVAQTQILIDLFGQYTSPDTQKTTDPRPYKLTQLKDIAREITTTVTQVGSQTYRVSFAFSTKSGIESDRFSAMLFNSIGVLDEEDRLELKEFYAWSDESLSIYEELVSGKLDDIQGSIDDLGNKIEEGNDQAHQDAEDIKDSIADLPEKEKEEAQNVGGGQFSAGQDALVGFDVSSLTGSIEALYQSMTYHGTESVFKLPTSGKVPFVGTVLWDEYTFSLLPAQIVEDPSFKVVQVIGKCLTTIGTAYVVLYVFNDLLTTFNGKKGGEG